MGATSQQELFADRHAGPDGLASQPNFLAPAEGAALLAAIRDLSLEPARYRSFTARRRIASFGAGYDFETNALTPAPPLPDVLHPLRDRLAAWAGVPPDAFGQCTVAEYRPGTPLGWHRDAPRFGIVAGVSLGAPARMRLRPYPHVTGAGTRALVLVLEPRSAYVLRGAVRRRWQHAISPTTALRFSVTFRTLRGA